MAGLKRICKRFGKLTVIGNTGNTAEWEYDYEQDKAVLKSVQQGLQQASEIYAGKKEGKTFDEFLNEIE